MQFKITLQIIGHANPKQALELAAKTAGNEAVRILTQLGGHEVDHCELELAGRESLKTEISNDKKTSKENEEIIAMGKEALATATKNVPPPAESIASEPEIANECPACKGSGFQNEALRSKCPTCDGTGTVPPAM